MILGTAAYMAPEQAKGRAGRQARRHLGVRLRALRDADRPARVRGRRRLRHAGVGAAREPDWTLLPPDTPPRDPRAAAPLPGEGSQRAAPRHRRRALELERSGEPKSADNAAAARASATGCLRCSPSRRDRGVRVGPSSGLSDALGPAPSPSRFTYTLPAGRDFGHRQQPSRSRPTAAFSRPTRRRLCTSAPWPRGTEAIPGTKGARRSPFFSPDGQWIGF